VRRVIALHVTAFLAGTRAVLQPVSDAPAKGKARRAS
jgi:hypothetical protein